VAVVACGLLVLLLSSSVSPPSASADIYSKRDRYGVLHFTNVPTDGTFKVMMHDAVGYTPYEGHVYTGWPQLVLSRGRIVVEDGELKVKRGSGQYLARGVPGPVAAAATIDGPARQLKKLIG
jgi:hypothetical protein